MFEYQIYKNVDGYAVPSRIVFATSAWLIELNKGELVFGKQFLK